MDMYYMIEIIHMDELFHSYIYDYEYQPINELMMVYVNFYILSKYSMTSYITDTPTILKGTLIQCICLLEHNELSDSKRDILIGNRIRSLRIYEKEKLREWISEMMYRMDFLCFNRSTKWLAKFRELLDILERELDKGLKDRQELQTIKSKLPLKSWNLLYLLYQNLWMQHLRSGANSLKLSSHLNQLFPSCEKSEKKSSRKSQSKTWRTISQSDIVIHR